MSQGGANHNLTKEQVSELCGTVLSIIHPNLNMDNHIRHTQDGKLMASLDVLSKNPCTYADNQLTCEMEFAALGKSHGVHQEITHFQKVRDGVYDVTSFKPDGKTVDTVQTMYQCSLTIPEAQAWVKSNPGSGEYGELQKRMFPPDKVEWLIKKAEEGNVRAQAGMGGMYLMAAILNTGVEHDPERGLALLEQAASQGNVDAYVMLGNSNSLDILANKSEDYSTAQKWYAKAAQAGHPGAQNAVGFLLLFGLPEKNASKAMTLMTQAAEQGHASAHFNLGVIQIFFPDDFRKQVGLPPNKDVLRGLMHLKLAQEKQLNGAIIIWQSLQSKLNPGLSNLVEGEVKAWKDKHPITLRGSYVYPSIDVGIHFKVDKSGQPLLNELDIRAGLIIDTMKMDSIFRLYSTSETIENRI